jgi:hypothetical protein
VPVQVVEVVVEVVSVQMVRPRLLREVHQVVVPQLQIVVRVVNLRSVQMAVYRNTVGRVGLECQQHQFYIPRVRLYLVVLVVVRAEGLRVLQMQLQLQVEPQVPMLPVVGLCQELVVRYQLVVGQEIVRLVTVVVMVGPVEVVRPLM